MNRRQKKKFLKKDRIKKYGVYTKLLFVNNDDGTTDILKYTYHNGSGKIYEATRFVNCYPVAAHITEFNPYESGHPSLVLEEPPEFMSNDTNTFKLEFAVSKPNIDDGVVSSMLKTWMDGLNEPTSEKEI